MSRRRAWLAHHARAWFHGVAFACGILAGFGAGAAGDAFFSCYDTSEESCLDLRTPPATAAGTTAASTALPAAPPAARTTLVEVPASASTSPASRSPSALALSIFRTPSTARPTLERSVELARLVETSCSGLDAWMVVGLMRHESGFRADAVGSSGLGIMQINPKYLRAGVDPLNPAEAIPEGCAKLRRWREWCDTHDADHDLWLAHWFGGERPGSLAHRYAEQVWMRAREMRVTGGL